MQAFNLQFEAFRAQHLGVLGKMIHKEQSEILDLFPDSEAAANVIRDLEVLANISGLKKKLSQNIIRSIAYLNIGGSSIIEVCGGSCWLLRAVLESAKIRGVEISAVGSDISVQHIESNSASFQAFDINWVTADATRLPYEDKKFDVAFNCQALHHFPPALVVQVLREMSRVARKVVVFDLRRTWYGPVFVKLLTPFFSKSFISDGVISHRRAYSFKEMEYLILSASLPYKVRRFTPVGMILESAYE